MSEFREHSDTIDVPRGTGVDGFIKAIIGILKMPRVQYINIDGNGRIKYARVVRKGEELTRFAPDFSDLLPSFIIRHAHLRELAEEDNAAYAITKLFQAVGVDKVYPVAFVTNPLTRLWDWFEESTGIDLSLTQDVLYGVPIVYDENIPNYALILCAALAPNAVMSETRFAYKITLPQAYTGG